MTINGKEIGFSLTLGALKELMERCPGGDIAHIEELFKGNNTVKILDNMAWFICILNKWDCYKKERSFEGAITEDDIFGLEIPELQDLFKFAMKSFKNDNTPTTEVTPAKK